MSEFSKIFKKVNGLQVLKQYAGAHVLVFSLLQTCLLGTSKKGLEIVRCAVDFKVLGRLRKKYRTFIAEYQRSRQVSTEKAATNKVWLLWYQGLDAAPEPVQKCVASVRENLPEHEVVLLTEENYTQYVTFPAFIQEKINTGVITKTHLSDLLRLSLLERYGGTWIDATVFLSSSDIPAYMTQADLFVFQCLKPGRDGHCTNISSWWMSAHANHPIIKLTKALLFEYWRTHNRLVDYYLIHDFFELAIEAYPEEWSKVIPVSNSTPHILLLRLFEPYDDALWQAVSRQTSVHKLTYKFSAGKSGAEGTYYDVLIRKGATCAGN